jgi:putative lipoprotein
MRPVRRFLLASLAFAAVIASARPAAADEDFWGPDKALHFGVSAGISLGAYGASTLFLEAPWQRALFASAVSLSAGAAKEAWDAMGNGTPSYADFAWDMAGTGVGVSIAFTLDVTEPFAARDR